MNAKKLPSGNYRARVLIGKDKDGKQHFKSFTAPTRREAELMALEYIDKHNPSGSMTVAQCIDRYIEMQTPVLDASTIHGYKNMRKVMFPELLSMKLEKVDNLVLKEAVAKETATFLPSGKKISAKTVHNRYGLLSPALRTFNEHINTKVSLPKIQKKIVDLPQPEEIYNAVKGSSIELPVMLAMWLSFSMSEILGLKHSSIHGDYIQIDQVKMIMGTELIEKSFAKVDTRIRRHRIPEYIKKLIDQLPPEQEYLVDMTAQTIYGRFDTLLKQAGIPKIAFHKLRHINASAMALLDIPDKYAQERGGWKTDSTMKSVYQHTFSKERIAVDNKIDDFFNEVVGMKKASSYKKFLNEYKLPDTDESKELFKKIQTMSDKKIL